MKRAYTTPKAKYIDFTYDVQVTAESSGIAYYGDPDQIGRCQQSSDETCRYYWNDDYPGSCSLTPLSLRQTI